MQFIAGIIGLENGIEPSRRKSFKKSLTIFKSFWPLVEITNEHYLLAYTGPADMWQGPKTLQNASYDAIAIGIQWKQIPSFSSASQYLTRQFLTDKPKIGNYFDNFACAIIDKKRNRCVLASDPLGMRPLMYYRDDQVLVFSSHQYFIRSYLGSIVSICWDAVFEFLLIGHLLGNKTLMTQVKLLPPGHTLQFHDSKVSLSPYDTIDNLMIDSQMSLEKACQTVWTYLHEKFISYKSVAKKDLIGLLSGGLDSRLIVAFLTHTKMLQTAYVVDRCFHRQCTTFNEGKIATEVAKILGIRLHHIKDRANDALYQLPQLVDYHSMHNAWGLSLNEELPYGKIFTDGLGGLFIKSPFITDDLYDCIKKRDKHRARDLLFAEYISGYASSSIYYFDAEHWKQVLDPHFISGQLTNLKRTITTELENIHCDNFVTVFQLKNRIRRFISRLPLMIFGGKGDTITPLCDPYFAKISLTMPVEIKRNLSLYECLLEKTKPGLSQIPSTNTKDVKKLRPYSSDPYANGSIIPFIFSKLPKRYQRLLWRLFNRFVYWLPFNLLYLPHARLILDEVINHPPDIFMHLFTPTLRHAIQNRKKHQLVKFLYPLYQLLILNRFFSKPQDNIALIRGHQNTHV